MATHVRFQKDGAEPSDFYRIETEDRAYVFQCENHELSHASAVNGSEVRFAATRYSMDEIEGFLTDAIAHRH